MDSTERTKALSEKLLKGVEETFQSGRFQQYLSFAARFHSYSMRNAILIMMQRPEATLVAGFEAWKKKKRYVKKGEHGIAIFAPVKVKARREVPVYGEDGEPQFAADGTQVTEETEQTILKFRVTYVYDVGQTDGEPIPEFTPQELTGGIKNFEQIFQAIQSVSPYEIGFETIQNGAKGYTNYSEKRIALNYGMSDEQTVKTAVHELAHATLHGGETKAKRTPNRQREVEAESVAFIVSSYLGIDTSSYSFDYIAGWSSDMKAEQLQEILEGIQGAANEIITRLDGQMQALGKERGEKNQEQEKLPERIQHATEAARVINRKRKEISCERSRFE